MNTENGMPMCENCHGDFYQEDMFFVIVHWEPDEDYNSISMCAQCAIRYSRIARAIYTSAGAELKFIEPKEREGHETRRVSY